MIEVRAWGENEHDTGYFQELQVTIVDPCFAEVLNIDDSVFKDPSDAVTLTQFVDYDTLSLSWDDTIVTNADIPFCGPLIHRIKDMTSGTAIELTGEPFFLGDL